LANPVVRVAIDWQTDGRVDGWMDGWMDGWRNGRMDGRMYDNMNTVVAPLLCRQTRVSRSGGSCPVSQSEIVSRTCLGVLAPVHGCFDHVDVDTVIIYRDPWYIESDAYRVVGSLAWHSGVRWPPPPHPHPNWQALNASSSSSSSSSESLNSSGHTHPLIPRHRRHLDPSQSPLGYFRPPPGHRRRFGSLAGSLQR